MPPFGSDNTNTGNYLLRDVSAAEAIESPERRQEKERCAEQQGLQLRMETVPASIGDRFPVEAITAMEGRTFSDDRVHGMLNGAEVAGEPGQQDEADESLSSGSRRYATTEVLAESPEPMHIQDLRDDFRPSGKDIADVARHLGQTQSERWQERVGGPGK